MPSRIISFSGRKKSGKTELATICSLYNYNIINFADHLKGLVCKVAGLKNTSELERTKDKVSPTTIPIQPHLQYISEETGIHLDTVVKVLIPVNFKSIRQLLQIIGTDLIRAHNPDWHIQKLRAVIQSAPSDTRFCIGDCRFVNEKRCVEDLGGECWFIMRPGYLTGVSNHISEIDLRWRMFEEKGERKVIINTLKSTLHTTWKRYLETGEPPQITYAIPKEEFSSAFFMEQCSVVENRMVVDIFGNTKSNPFIIEDFKVYIDAVYLDCPNESCLHRVIVLKDTPNPVKCDKCSTEYEKLKQRRLLR